MIYPLTVQAERLAGQARADRRPARRHRPHVDVRGGEPRRQPPGQRVPRSRSQARRALHLVRAELDRRVHAGARARARSARRRCRSTTGSRPRRPPTSSITATPADLVDAEHAETVRANPRPDPEAARHPDLRRRARRPACSTATAVRARRRRGAAAPRRPTAATMIYTSGTTGRPKGALRQAARSRQRRPLILHIGYRQDDVYLTTGPALSLGPRRLHVSRRSSATPSCCSAASTPRTGCGWWQKYRVTTTFSAPTPIRLVCNLPAEVKARYDRSSMKRMIANAAPWSFALKEAYLADFPRTRCGRSTAPPSSA